MSYQFVRRIRLSEELQARAEATFSQAMFQYLNAKARIAGAAEIAIKFLNRTLEYATYDSYPALWLEAHLARKDMVQLLGYHAEKSETDHEE